MISPHADDIALSMGGLLGSLTLNRSLPKTLHFTVVLVFSRSLYNRYRPQIRGLDAISLMRLNEERTYLSKLGGNIIDLGFPDSSCLGISDEDENSISMQDDQRSSEVFRAVNEILVSQKPGIVLVPAALGAQIDHRIALEAVRRADIPPTSLVFYEDLPYAAALTLIEIDRSFLAITGRLNPITVNVSSSWDTKLRGLECYPSQISNNEIVLVDAHSRRLAKVPHAERFWAEVNIAQ